MSKKKEKDSLGNGLGVVLAFAGAIWGSEIAANDPEISTEAGVIAGLILGFAAGKITSIVLNIVIQIIIGLVGLGIIILRFYNIVNALGG